MTAPTEARVREIVREQLVSVSEAFVDVLGELDDSLPQRIGLRSNLAHLLDQSRELLDEPSRLVGQLDVAHDREGNHAAARLVVDRILERFVGPEVVGDHVSQHVGGGPGSGDIQISPGVAQDTSPSSVDGTPSVGDGQAGAAAEAAPDQGGLGPLDLREPELKSCDGMDQGADGGNGPGAGGLHAVGQGGSLGVDVGEDVVERLGDGCADIGQAERVGHELSPSLVVGDTPTVGEGSDAGAGDAPASGAPTLPLAGSAAEIGLRLANRALAFGSKAAADYAAGLAGTVLRQRTCCPTTAGDEHMVQCPAWQPGLTVEEIAHLRATVLKGVMSS